MITGVHHFSLSVSDADRSIAFYRDLFGLEVDSDREVKGDYVEVITGMPGAHLRIVHLSAYGHRLELLEYKQPRGADRARTFPDAGSAHVCFLTDDIHEACRRVEAAGFGLISPPVETTSGPNKGGFGVYLRDPDGNAVEIIQLARPWPARGAASGR